MIRFKGKIRPSGAAHIVTVPKALLEGGNLSTDKTYLFTVENDASQPQ